jgi:hypothetical protein
MRNEDHMDALLREARTGPVPVPSTALISRVLADAAALVPGPAPAPAHAAATAPGWLARLLFPVGGLGGALALAACAVFGVVAGADYADEVLALPGLNGVLAGLADYTDTTTPDESLALLMSEG